MRNIFLALFFLVAPQVRAVTLAQPAWRNGVFGEVFAFAQKSTPDAGTAPRGIITGNQLLREIESSAPGFFAEAEKLWQEASSAQRAQIKKVLDGKLRQALLTFTLSHALDVQAAAVGWKADPSDPRLDYAVRTLLLQIAVEGPMHLAHSTASAKSDAWLMHSLIRSESQIRAQAEERGQSYLELKLDQDWNYRFLGKFREPAPGNSAPDWPALSLEFRCAKNAASGKWSACFPGSLLELRSTLQRQLNLAYAATVRSTIFNALLWRDNPRLDQEMKLILPRDYDRTYASLAAEWFKAQMIHSQVAIVTDAARKELSAEVVSALLHQLEMNKSASSSLTQLYTDAVAATEKEMGLSLRVSFEKIRGSAQKKPTTALEAFALSSPVLECGGSFSLYPCKAAGNLGTWFLVERTPQSTNQILAKTHPWVKERVEATLRAQAMKAAQTVTLKKLLKRSQWVFATDPGAKDTAWPNFAKHRTIPSDSLFSDLADWTAAIRF